MTDGAMARERFQSDGGSRSDTEQIETWCPLDGEITATLGEDGAFHCPDCNLAIPKRILVYGPPEDRGGGGGGE